MEEDVADFAYLAVTETNDLGMYAVVLCPKQVRKTNVKHGDKVSYFSH